MRIVFFGAGAFGLPTLEHLHARETVELVVSQPDRGAGRGRRAAPTPVSAAAEALGIELDKVLDVNAPECVQRLHAVQADAWVIIAFGQKLGQALLHNRFAVNLHGSLLPRWRGAAPIHHAIMAGDARTGVSVITLASVMDAGEVLGSAAHPIGPSDTTAHVHDALAQLGPEVVASVLRAHADGQLESRAQDEAAMTLAPKLSRADACLDLSKPADTVRCRINGLSPWPGCRLLAMGDELRVLQADRSQQELPVGVLDETGSLGCGDGSIALLQVQPSGSRVMDFRTWANGRRLSGHVQVEVPQ
jgi:methionyl-tRNA formyltransferase